MKNLVNKFLAINMSLLVFITSTSFAFGMHFCGDKLIEFSFSKNELNCHMEMGHDNNPISEAGDECEDKIIAFDHEFISKSTLKEIEINLFTVYHTLKSSSIDYDWKLNKIDPYQFYKPPLISKEISNLYGVYLL